MKFEYLENGKPEVCEEILRSVPDWFGIEESTVAYISRSKELPMVIATMDEKPVGFLSLRHHSSFTTEIYVMGVLPEYHRSGIGKKLLIEAEKVLSNQEVDFLQVKTVSSDRECEFYKKTRLFYKSFGFKEVEVFPSLWDEANPCQLLIKSVSKEASNVDKIIISKYSKEWPKQFEDIRALLISCVADDVVSIDHIGSTSVPGLGAKDKIDVQITVKEITDDFKVLLDSKLNKGGFLESKNYSDHRPPGDTFDDSHWKKLFVSGVHSELNFKFNIHIREIGKENQQYPLLFRDFLREHPNSAGAYEMLKRELSRYLPYDIEAYCEIKDPGCDLIMAHARDWANRVNWTVEKSLEK